MQKSILKNIVSNKVGAVPQYSKKVRPYLIIYLFFLLAPSRARAGLMGWLFIYFCHSLARWLVLLMAPDYSFIFLARPLARLWFVRILDYLFILLARSLPRSFTYAYPIIYFISFFFRPSRFLCFSGAVPDSFIYLFPHSISHPLSSPSHPFIYLFIDIFIY